MTASALAASLARIGHVQPHLSGPVAVVLATVAIGALAPGIWLLTQHVTTIAHEAAHATVASSFGHKIDGVTFNFRAFGATAHHGPSGALGRNTITFIGYLGPSAFGILAAELISVGHSVAVLWIGLVVLLGILVSLRRSFGIVTVSVAFILLFLVAGFADVGVQVVLAYLIAWFMLASGVRMIRADGADAGDARKLVSTTKIPARFWSAVWLAGSLVALIFGATLLV
ncbi:MAG: M50 family metallopeptidase [Streptosporangiaceae bacterium]